jgi:hypothetical protein
VGNIASMEEMGNVFRILVGNLGVGQRANDP